MDVSERALAAVREYLAEVGVSSEDAEGALYVRPGEGRFMIRVDYYQSVLRVALDALVFVTADDPAEVRRLVAVQPALFQLCVTDDEADQQSVWLMHRWLCERLSQEGFLWMFEMFVQAERECFQRLSAELSGTR